MQKLAGRITVFHFAILWGSWLALACSAGAATPEKADPNAYVLGSGDQVVIEVADLEELNAKPHRINTNGDLSLPLIGTFRASGLTLRGLESYVNSELKGQLKEPRVTAVLTESRSQPVSVLGAVNTPGVRQIQGGQSLFEVLSEAGGLRPDAGYRIAITRRAEYGKLPLPGVVEDPSNHVSEASVNVQDVMESADPALNIQVMPHDVITIPRAKLVYAIGEVRKAGGFTLQDNQTVSILQVLSLAEGLSPNAKKDKARILRRIDGGTNRTEIAVDLKQIMAGKADDIPLRADDILFVPNSVSRGIRNRAIDTAISTISGIAIWRGL